MKTITLCKQDINKTELYEVTEEVSNVELEINLGEINKITFTVPVYLKWDGETVKNPLVEKINNYHLIKLEWNGVVEYFVYTKGNRKIEVDGKNYNYTLHSLPKLLEKKVLQNIVLENLNLCTLMNVLLIDTNWNISHVDSQLNQMTKTYETTETNVLQAVYDVSAMYGAIVEWDTTNQTIKFSCSDSFGKNKGFKLNEGKIERLAESIKSKNELVSTSYKTALESINTAIEAMQAIQTNTSYSSAEYREALKSQVTLENTKLELIRNELVNVKSVFGRI